MKMKYIKILKAIARVTLDYESKKTIINFTTSKIDNYIFNKLLQHKLHYLYYKHLEELNILKEIDKYNQRSLNSQFVFWQLMYAEYLDIIKKLTNKFIEYNIDYSLIKGISLVNTLYTNKSLVYRKFNDIDILIDKKNVNIVNKIICGFDFIQGCLDDNNNIIKAPRKEIIYWSLNSHQEHEYIKKSVYSFYIPGIINCIDINTTFFEGGKFEIPISTRKILENKRDQELPNGINLHCLNYTYELLQLCYHFYKDTVYDIKKAEKEDYCLIRFCDIREYILKFQKKINWDEFITIINENMLGDKIYHTLSLVSSFYGDLALDNIMTKIETNSKILVPNWDEII